jgi:uncharacterized protein
MTQTQASLINFPCIFPIKVIGLNQIDFTLIITKGVQIICPDFNAENIEISKHSSAKYLSLTLNVYVNDKNQLDNIYQYLSSHAMVKFVL